MQDIVEVEWAAGAATGSRSGAPIVAGFRELLKAYEYAQDAGCAVWDLAVEAALLREFGLTASDLRWLVCKGYVEHARDVTRQDDESRSFRSCAKLVFAKRSCFVLTERGAVHARCVVSSEFQTCAAPAEPIEHLGDNGNSNRVALASSTKPRWNNELRELRLNRILVKQFKWAAANQEAILAAFEEEDWPNHIDDPLSPEPEQDSKRRLSDTIKCLNRKQQNALIHFRGDGTGEGVIWELVEPDRD